MKQNKPKKGAKPPKPTIVKQDEPKKPAEKAK